MTRFDLHPEELFDRAARGAASDADLTRLDSHLEECDVCRVERALAAQAALDGAPLRDEQLLVARLKRDVAARLVAPAARPARRKGVIAAAFLAVSVAGAAAAATLVIVRGAPAPEQLAPAQAPAPPPAQVEALDVVDEGAPAQPELPPAAAPSVTSPDPGPKPAVVEATTPSELFSRANQARRDGRVKEAARLYRALQERFSGSSEELVSRVTLGRLLLDRLGDSRGALVQFNSYLASPGGGALREEAMVGRALALGRMGRTVEERTAWKALLDAWPTSSYQKRARARLTELGAPGTAAPLRPGSSPSEGRTR